MKISTPQVGRRVNYSATDLADPYLYTNGDPHLVWQSLRAAEPVYWRAGPGEGFWVVTRRADVRRVLGEYETFSSEHGTSLAMLGGPDPAAGLMMHATDPPRHQRFREQLGQPLSAHAVPAYQQTITAVVRETVAPALDGGIWDAAAAFTRVPMAITGSLMALPDADIDPLLRRAFATLAPLDPLYRTGSERETLARAHYEIMEYFSACLAERRKQPGTDLISHLLSTEVEGRHLTEQELLLNCLSLTVGAVVTTSQVVSAMLLALAEERGGEGRWPSDVPIDAFVEEALRWSSPVTHFMRRARIDVEWHGKSIRAGDAVTAWIASGNRDEGVFDQPYAFDTSRRPNRHIAFGSGPHRCVGAPLARVILREIFRVLFTEIQSFELVGAPSHLVSNQIAGVTSLPIRVKPRSKRSLLAAASDTVGESG